MQMTSTSGLLLGIALGISCATGSESGSPPPATAAAASPSAATALAQADRGEKLYVENCAQCHGNAGQGTQSEKGRVPPVVGPTALPLDPPAGAKYRKGQFRTARDVYEFVRENMPPGMGNTLPVEDYLDIIAFDLKANGVDLNGKSITSDTAAAIVLHP
jgi:cytochrome c